ncbi:MAG: hypothetical protein ACJ07L_04410 [Opitutales bacterium]
MKTDQDFFAEVELLEQLEQIGPFFKFRAKVSQDGQLKAKLVFSLMNLPEDHLL